MHWVIVAIVTAAIPLVTAYIALRRWQTDRNKPKLELYERRLRVYEAARTLMNQMVNFNGDLLGNQIAVFVQGTTQATFLFSNKEVHFLAELREKASSLRSAQRQLERISGRAENDDKITKLADQENELIGWAEENLKTLADRFQKYLNLSSYK